MFKSILIATDGSELAGKGLAAGLDLAKSTGSGVTVVIVSEPFPVYDLGTQIGLFSDQAAIDAYDARCRDLAEAVLTKARQAADAAGVGCETVHVPDRGPAAGILDTAKARGCDLIVLTSQGRRGLERFLLGSQAQKVVQNAETSVLVIR